MIRAMIRATVRIAPLGLVLLLAACVPAPPATVSAPAPAPAPTFAPPPVVLAEAPLPTPVAADWTSAPLTTGNWRWRSADGASSAEFIIPTGQVQVQIACNPAPRQVFISVVGAPAGDMTIRTETADRVIVTNLSGVFARALILPTDSLLDAIAFSRGRFALEAPGHAYYLPSYPEITRVVEDCR
jgi:hypothetical protein